MRNPEPNVARDVEQMRRDGFVVLERLLSAQDLLAYREALAPHLARGPFGRNEFEGRKTQRVYSLPGIARPLADLAAHPRVLAILDALLAPNYLLTAAQAICIHPGETAQGLHFDDSFYPVPRPRPAISIATICAIDDFTEENGATEVIAGSHRWGVEVPRGVVDAEAFAQESTYGHGIVGPESKLMRPRTEERGGIDAEITPARMPAGSVLVFLGTLWHRGGANRSNAPRLALSYQYCEPWARQQENFMLSIPVEVTRGLPERVQELLGYSIHPPFMGHVRGLHPKRRLS